jgi:hypothetical protein
LLKTQVLYYLKYLHSSNKIGNTYLVEASVHLLPSVVIYVPYSALGLQNMKYRIKSVGSYRCVIFWIDIIEDINKFNGNYPQYIHPLICWAHFLHSDLTKADGNLGLTVWDGYSGRVQKMINAPFTDTKITFVYNMQYIIVSVCWANTIWIFEVCSIILPCRENKLQMYVVDI